MVGGSILPHGLFSFHKRIPNTQHQKVLSCLAFSMFAPNVWVRSDYESRKATSSVGRVHCCLSGACSPGFPSSGIPFGILIILRCRRRRKYMAASLRVYSEFLLFLTLAMRDLSSSSVEVRIGIPSICIL